MRLSKKNILYFFLDLLLFQISFLVSFLIRFEGRLPKSFKVFAILIIPLTCFKIISFILNNLYKRVWRYANLKDIVSIVQSLTISNVIFTGYIFFLQMNFPRSIIILDWMVSILLIGASRFIVRIWMEFYHQTFKNKDAKKALIIGAGDAGELVLKEYNKHRELNTEIIGFIDDDPAKYKMQIHGVKVLGNRKKIPQIVDRYNVDEVIIAIPSASGKDIREIHKLCSLTKAIVRILPGVYEIINGDVKLSQIREVQVEDLLGREPVKINLDEIAAYVTNKRILITGGGGSIGSEICRQIARFQLEKLIILDFSENNIYEIELELKQRYKDIDIIPVIANIQDKNKLYHVFQEYQPHVVFHAAAHKHVPLMELNPEEAIKNNIFGTRNVALIADEFGVERFVMISTDKAVNPTNVMGATKRVAEMIVQDMAKRSKTKFVAVRFGNVLASRGSVIPLFKKQIMEGGPVTVTHPEITRYFMTIPEASQLVIQAGALGRGGEVFVLDMGKPVKIIELANDLIELSGFKVGEDIEIKITGLRPGEKLYEELLSDKETTLATKHERILVAKLDEVNYEVLNQLLEQLEQLSQSGMPDHLIKILVKLVVSYKPSNLYKNVLEYEKDVI